MNKLKQISSCQELFKSIVGTREGLFYYNSLFRQDFELMCYKGSRYDFLLEQNKKQKEIINKTINDINITIEIIKQQPTGNDSWIIDKLNGLKIVLEDKGE